jgi:hypothetical protein
MTKQQAGGLIRDLLTAGHSFSVDERATGDWVVTLAQTGPVDAAKLAAEAAKHGLTFMAQGGSFS